MLPPIADRIRTALSSGSLNCQQLAKAVVVSPAELQAELRRLETSGRIYNVGSDEYPMWTWRLSEPISSETLLEAVIRLLSERPTAIRELANATGADLRRVALAVRAIQRRPEGERLINLGAEDAARWFMPPPGARRHSRPTPLRSRRNPRLVR